MPSDPEADNASSRPSTAVSSLLTKNDATEPIDDRSCPLALADSSPASQASWTSR